MPESVYNVTLVNLTADARSVAELACVEQRGLGDDDLRRRLRDFSGIDPIANAGAETEIRVQVRRESYLVRTEQRKLILYDMNRRDLPAQLLTVEEAMRELDGTAAAAREESVMVARATMVPWAAASPELAVPVAPEVTASTPRVIGMIGAAGLLLAAIVLVGPPFAGDETPAGFVPAAEDELFLLHASLNGVYLTGSEPGQHGIAIAGPGELKLFELAAVEAPRVIQAAYKPGRMGANVFLATDQPGGLIEVRGAETLVYCGEIYRRIP